MFISDADVETAYRKLKSYVYYDKTDLRLRTRLAAFECSKDFLDKLESVKEVLNSDEPTVEPGFQQWLSDVNFRIVPKKIRSESDDEFNCDDHHGKFITNVTSAKTIHVDKVNYFFDGPIELYIISVLWIMIEGRHLDAQLFPECCGSRLSEKLRNEGDESLQLFSKYHEQYARWRDTGIRKAKQLLTDENKNVAILGLDLQEYFYRINIDFDGVGDKLKSINKSNDEEGSSVLLGCIKAIGLAYRASIQQLMLKTHPDIEESVTGLPIGLPSSLVLANWYLQDFDASILNGIKPAYYGRYVDDILLVVPIGRMPASKSGGPVKAFLQELLVNAGLLEEIEDGTYEVQARPGLRLQQSKCILQYFDAKHSIAGLEKFQKKLEENGSDFLLLPVDEADNSMEDIAYELLYEGSVNKFRSVKGVAENRYELAKHLARQTILHLVTDDPPDRTVSKGLQKFFKGRSAIEFFDLWERVLTLLGISGDGSTLRAFTKQLKSEISSVRTGVPAVTKALQRDLENHLLFSLAMSEAVCSEDVGLSDIVDDIHSEHLRRSNMLRHHFVRAPLLNFTTYAGPLSARKLMKRAKLDKEKLQRTPRFINFDECMLLAYSGNVETSRKSPFEFASSVFEEANRQDISGITWIKLEAEED